MNGRDMVSTRTRNPSVRAGVDRMAPLSIRSQVKCYSIRHRGIAARNADDPDGLLVRLVIGSAGRRKLRSLSRCMPLRLNSRVVGPTRLVEGYGKPSPLVAGPKPDMHVEQAVEMFADGGSIPPASTIDERNAERGEV